MGFGKWAAIGSLVFAGGGGAAFIVSALRGDPTPAPPRATAPVAVVVTSPPTAVPTRSPPPAPTRAPAPEPAAEAPKPIAPPPVESPKPPTWIADAERANPWITLEPAAFDRLLGVSVDALSQPYADKITGLWPDRRVMAPREAFAIQQHEVTWAELELAAGTVNLNSVSAPAWVPTDPKKRSALPATNVPWHIARAYCRTIGGDLPSEAQWEWAARGTDDHYFPWGRQAVDSNKVRIFAKKPVPLAAVGKSSQDVTPTGVRDLLGNAQEWTRDTWTPGNITRGKLPVESMRVVRGWPLTEKGEDVPSEGSTYREAECADKACEPSPQLALIGFRCAKDIDP